MSDTELLFGAGVVVVVMGVVYVIGVVFNAVLGNTNPTGDDNMKAGCGGVVLIGIFLTLLYGFVRFVKWAWE